MYVCIPKEPINRTSAASYAADVLRYLINLINPMNAVSLALPLIAKDIGRKIKKAAIRQSAAASTPLRMPKITPINGIIDISPKNHPSISHTMRLRICVIRIKSP